MTSLTVGDLHAGYGQAKVLRGVTIDVADGDAIGLLGPNGHGKSTLLRCISGLHRPTAGSITYDGAPIVGRTPSHIVNAGLVHVPQGSRLFPAISVEDSLRMAASAVGAASAWREAADEVYAVFPKLKERRRQLTGTLSGGERQMASVGMALMARPRLLVLDEPTLGLSPRVKYELTECIARVRATVRALILVDGDVDLVMGLTDRYYVLQLGQVVSTGDSKNMGDRSDLMALFLGGGVDGRH